MTLKRPSYLFPRRGSAWEGRATTKYEGPGRAGYTRRDLSVAPVPSPLAWLSRRESVAVRLNTEPGGSLRLLRPWGRPQLFITSAEHSASALARA